MTLYVGFDPSADSLHVGNLVPLLLLRRFQLAGHLPIALAGGATGMVGDPGGRSEERNLLDAETLDRNTRAIKAQLSAFLDFEPGPCQARLVDNRDWTAPLGVLDFLRDVGKHMTVNYMLAKESVRSRVASEHGISFTEFSYMLLQANDYAWLHEHMNCELQAGGSDQWGNITAGIDLTRRRNGASVHGLTVPLVTRCGRGEVRQERRRGALARSRAHVALRALPVLREPARRRCRALPAAAHARARRGGPARRCASTPARPSAARASAAGLGDVRADPRRRGGRRGGGGLARALRARAGSLSAGQLAALSDEIPTTHTEVARPRRRRPARRERARGQQGRGAPADRRRRDLRQRRRARARAGSWAPTTCCTAAT